MNGNKITLYPTNWLYNSGVLGVIRVLEKIDCNMENNLLNDGTFLLNIDLLSIYQPQVVNEFKLTNFGLHWLLESLEEISPQPNLDVDEKAKKAWGMLFNVFYRGFFNANTQYFYNASNTSPALIEQFNNYLNSFTNQNESKTKCTFCLREANATYKNNYTSEHSKLLGTSSGDKGVPNSFWNMDKNNSISICDYCSMVIISGHLSRIKMLGNSEIFINAPSFKVMYELNKLVKESFGSANNAEARTKREILASSVIEYTNKIQTSLGIWTGMNIEIVTKKKDVIEFYSLPYNVIKLITDRQIASILSDLGEYSIYNIVLDEKYSRLIDITQKVLKLSTKEQLSKNEENLMKEFLNNWKNQKHLTATANKLLKLYSLIEDKLKRN
jgi:CRISPR-associated protein Cst1